MTRFLAAVIACRCSPPRPPSPPGTRRRSARRDTLEFLTVGPDEGEHWSTVWLVVIDGQVYIRLGSRAAERMEQNTTAPYVKVRIAGQQFDRVKAEPAPDMVEPVAAAMGDKYWSDVLVRYFNHPLTMRLTPGIVDGTG